MADDKQRQSRIKAASTGRITAQLDPSTVNQEERTISFPASSGRPLWNSGWTGEQEYLTQINLDGVDLEWINQGNAPMLWMHDDYTPIGRILSGEVVQKGMDRELRLTAKFFDGNEKADEVWMQVSKGEMRNVSLGYQVKPDAVTVHQMQVPSAKDAGITVEVDLLRFEQIEVHECSVVSVPLDRNINIGQSNKSGERTHVDTGRPVSDEVAQAVQQALHIGVQQSETSDPGGNPMTDQSNGETEQNAVQETETQEEQMNAAPEAAPDVTQKAKHTITQKQVSYDPSGQRYLADNEARMKQTFGLTDEQVQELRSFADNDVNGVKQGRSETEVQAKATQVLMKQMDNKDAQGAGAMKVNQKAPSVHTQEHEFSIDNVIKQLAKGRPADMLDGFEAEQIKEGMIRQSSSKVELPECYSGGANSVFIPNHLIMQDAGARDVMLNVPAENRKLQSRTEAVSQRINQINVGATPDRFWTPVFEESWFSESLVAQAKLISKVNVMAGELYQDLIGVTESGSWNVTHHSERGSRTENTGLTWATRRLEWHGITAHLDVTKRTLDQSRFFFARLLETMRRDTMRGQNQALINGASANHSPTGILNFTGINSVAVGAPAYSDITAIRREFFENNADTVMGERCWVMTPGTVEKLYGTPRLVGQGSTGGAGDSIIKGMPEGMMSIDGAEVIQENNLPQTGGASNNLHSMIFGTPSDIDWGMFSGMELLVDPYSNAETSDTRVFLTQAYDFSPRHVDSFVVATDVDPS